MDIAGFDNVTEKLKYWKILLLRLCQRCANGGLQGVMPPLFSKLPENWSKVSNTASEWATAFSVTFFCLVRIVGQLVKMPPPHGKCLGRSLGCANKFHSPCYL